MAASDDEHAVSSVDARPAQAEHVRQPARGRVAPAAERHVEIDGFWIGEQPALEVAQPLADEHAVREPRSASASWPASSSASHAISHSKRCCGSMRSASRGEIPKKAGSKRSIPSRYPRSAS